MSSLTPVRDDRSAPRDLSVSGPRARPHGFPWSGRVTRPRSLFYVALLRRGFRFGQAEAKRQGACGAKHPGDSASRHCGDAARPWSFALTNPPPCAAHGNGRHRACLPLMSFPVISQSRRISSLAPSMSGLLTGKAYTRPGTPQRQTSLFSPKSTGALSRAKATRRKMCIFLSAPGSLD
jgi:hypothetical protein